MSRENTDNFNVFSIIRPRPKRKIEIQTMPDLLVKVDGSPLHLGHTKQEELFALLVDRGAVGITGGEAIACLWPDKTVGDSIYWVTMSRLKDKLKEAGIDNIIGTDGKTKYLRTDQVECDLYRILSEKKDAIADYHGSYLERFSWAEEPTVLCCYFFIFSPENSPKCKGLVRVVVVSYNRIWAVS